MGVDLKYHIVSLIAVFLALGIGIVVGSTLVPLPTVFERQNAIINKLEKDFKDIRKETQKVKKSLELNEKFQKEVLPLLITNRLKGLKVAVVETNELSNDFVQNTLISTLNQAGAEIETIISIREKFGLEDEILRNKVTSHLGIKSDNLDNILQNIAVRIAQEIIDGQKIPLLSYLKSENLLQYKGDFWFKPEAVIIIGGRFKKDSMSVKSMDLPLIKTLKSTGIRVVGTEPVEVKESYIPFYQDEEISTIDNIDTVPGQIALIYVLEGKEGSFGIKRTASQFLPRVLVD